MRAFPLLCPRPKVVRATDIFVELNTNASVSAPSDWLHGAFRRRVEESLNRLTASLPGCRLALKTAAEPCLLDIFHEAGIPAEGFRLTVREAGCKLAAGSPAGAWYGLLAFEQMLIQGEGGIPLCEIEDEPGFLSRGVMLDISRCKVPTMETLRFLIARLARLRINRLQLYTEHTFAYTGHEVVWRNASPMTPEEVRELDRLCTEHFMVLEPNQNSFGHFERWLRHPEYRRFAESPHGFTSPWGTVFPYGSVLRPDDDSLKLLEGLYDQLLPNFSARVFNVGCDETYELGEGWSRSRCEKQGRHRVYLDFLLEIHRLVKARGFRMQFWGDIILKQPELIAELPPDVTALAWGYEADHPFARECEQFRTSGIPFHVCPGTSSWNSLTGKWTNAMENLRQAAKYGRDAGASGYLITDWGDNGHHQPISISFLPFAAGACLAWSPGGVRSFEAEAAASWAFFDHPSYAGVRNLAALGRVSDMIGERFYNSTAFHHALFHSEEMTPTLSERFSKIVPREWEMADHLLEALAELTSDFGTEDLVRREYLHAIAMARAGIARRNFREGRSKDEARLQQALGIVREEHEAIWLARNRLGGLAESLAKFPSL